MIQSMLLIGTLRHLSSPASRLHAVSRIICIFIVIIIMNNPFVGLNWNQRDMDAFIALVYLGRVLKRRRRRRRRRYWVRPWLQRRPMLGQYDTLFQELDRECQGDYMNSIRLDRNVFNEVLQRVAPRIAMNDIYRQPLDPGMKLVITLRHLATGDSYRSLEPP